MRVVLEFENPSLGMITGEKITSFSFICSIFKSYSMAKIVIKDFGKASYNYIKSGLPVNLSFVDDRNDFHTSKMKIFSFTKVPAPQQSIVDYLEISLISSIYFDKTINTAYYDGNVSTIIENIMSRYFKDSVVRYSGTSTDDMPRRRYQTQERTLDFVNRILKYGIQDKSPVYLFHDAYGVLNLRGISEMSKESPECTAVSLENEINPMLSLPDRSDKAVRMWSFQSLYNGKTACSQIDSIFTVNNFRFGDENVKTYSFSSAEMGNSQVYDTTPPKVKFYGWNLTPMDAYAIAAKESYEETYNTCSFTGTFMGFDLENIKLGKTIYIKLPYTPPTENRTSGDSNLGEGKYLITDISYDIIRNVPQTTATMVQIKS